MDHAHHPRTSLLYSTTVLYDIVAQIASFLPRMYSVYSKPDDSNTMLDVIHDEVIQQKVLEECYPVLVRKLHAYQLQPLLQQQQLLTDADSQVLLSDSRTNEEMAHYLVKKLPSKQMGWFQSLLWCLKQSTIGTGHDMIYEALISKYEELRKFATVNRNSIKKVIIVQYS